MSLLKCTILDDYQNVATNMADWSRLADRVKVETLNHHINTEDALCEALKESDIVVVMRERTPLSAATLRRLPRLKLIVTSGMRNASIDIKAAELLGIQVSGTGSSSEPPTELTWALLLAMARRIVPEANALKDSGPWQSTLGVDLNGKCLGILGLGKIGTRVARIGAAFGMDVVAWSPNLTLERAKAAGVRLAKSKEELLKESDFLTIHLVLGPTTQGIIGAAELEMMRPSAHLINTSRAPLVDQDALFDALRSNRIAGAAIDVFSFEPLPNHDATRTVPNLLATPHLGYVTENNYRVYFKEAVEDIDAFIHGNPIRLLAAKATP
jgi:phosphoglycerate dehydrogenase-like enzyme